MAFARSRINHAKLLLAVPDAEMGQHIQEAQQLVRSMSYYYLSPVFLFSCGPSLRQQLKIKYGIDDDIKFCDPFMNLITVPFTDELFLFTGTIAAAIILTLFLLPHMQQTAFNKGYDEIYDDDTGFSSWFETGTAYKKASHNSTICHFCNQQIVCNVNDNTGNWICNPYYYESKNSIDCPMVSNPNISAKLSSECQQVIIYIDPTSFENGTYITYQTFPIDDYYYNWTAIMCNRTVLALEYQKDVLKDWIWAVAGIVTAGVTAIAFVHLVLYYCLPHLDAVYPESYRLVRRENPSARPSAPITRPINA